VTLICRKSRLLQPIHKFLQADFPFHELPHKAANYVIDFLGIQPLGKGPAVNDFNAYGLVLTLNASQADCRGKGGDPQAGSIDLALEAALSSAITFQLSF